MNNTESFIEVDLCNKTRIISTKINFTKDLRYFRIYKGYYLNNFQPRE